MTGNKIGEYRINRISIKKFFLNPTFAEIKSLDKKEIKWFLISKFNVKAIDDIWEELTVIMRIALNRELDGAKISELIIETSYHLVKGLNFDLKYIILGILINQTAAQCQGAWTVKHTNPILIAELPQTFNKYIEQEVSLKKEIYEKWQ